MDKLVGGGLFRSGVEQSEEDGIFPFPWREIKVFSSAILIDFA